VTTVDVSGNINMSSAAGKICHDTACIHFTNATGQYWNSGSVYQIYNGTNMVMKG
jgi:hypothetical protein